MSESVLELRVDNSVECLFFSSSNPLECRNDFNSDTEGSYSCGFFFFLAFLSLTALLEFYQGLFPGIDYDTLF